MTATVKLNWCVPAAEWDAFREHVREKHGEINGWLGIEVERAMREFIDADEFAWLDKWLDDLVRAAGRTPAELGEEKTFVSMNGPTTRARARVSREVKEEFTAYVDRETDDSPGVVLARALHERRDGGRAGQTKRKAERVGEDAEALLAELNPDEDGMNTVEKRTVAMCSLLGEQFTRVELEDAIDSVVGDSPPTIDKYSERVLDRLDYTTHPENSDLFISASERLEIARNLAEERRREAEREADALFGTETGTAEADGGELRR